MRPAAARLARENTTAEIAQLQARQVHDLTLITRTPDRDVR